MKHNINRATLLSPAIALAFLAACRQPTTDQPVTVSPSPLFVVADSLGKAEVKTTFRVPAYYVSKRSRIVIDPRLVVADTVADRLQPLAIYSPIYDKKVNRAVKLDHYTDQYAGHTTRLTDLSQETWLHYDANVSLPCGADTARIVAVVSIDGCGECTGIDTTLVATLCRPEKPKEQPKKEEVLTETALRVIPQIIKGNGVAHLQFVINKYDINPDMGNNRSELEAMVVNLAPIVGDTTITLTSLTIYGVASADGSLPFNTQLSRNRANAAKDWLVDRLALGEDIQRIITIGSHPEGWQPVLNAMKADHHPDAPKVKAIIDRYADQDDDVAERYIRRLACWKDIREKYLQKDRKVEYTFSYYKKSHTYKIETIEKKGDSKR